MGWWLTRAGPDPVLPWIVVAALAAAGAAAMLPPEPVHDDKAKAAAWRARMAGVGELPWFVRNVVIKVLLVLRLPGVAKLLGSDGSWPY